MTKKDAIFEKNHIEVRRNTAKTLTYYEQLNEFIETSDGDGLLKLRNFAKYTPRPVLTSFMARHELFKLIVDVPGSIIEAGVLHGQGLMTFAQMSAILEPVNYLRKIIGFDTFEGFTELSDEDATQTGGEQVKVGGFKAESYEELQRAAELYDMNRPIGHIPKIQLVKGRIQDTLPTYLDENPHTVVAMLYLDMDLYDPTKFAIENLKDRIPKGGVIVFDELNFDDWPGETRAVMETLGIPNLKLKRFYYDHKISYCVME